MVGVANRDAGLECLAKAEAALKAGDLAKAQKFVLKAERLLPEGSVESLKRKVASVKSNPSTSNGTTPTSGTGSASASGMRHRTSATSAQRPASSPSSSRGPPSPPPPREDTSTPEQRAQVARVLGAKNHYDVLGIARDANDSAIKKAYRKLALQMHPDKNTAARAEEAFKRVSTAYAVLSDTDKRAFFDRTGHDDTASAQAAAAAHQNARARQYHSYGGAYDEVDPEEIFRMFFGSSPFPGGTRYTYTRGRPRSQQQRQNEREQPRSPLTGLLNLLPILVLFMFTFFSSPNEPIYSLSKQDPYFDTVNTHRAKVPYYVKDTQQFERAYPERSRDRLVLEREIERGYREHLYSKCHQEKLRQKQLLRWGQRQRAEELKLTHCEELEERFGGGAFGSGVVF